MAHLADNLMLIDISDPAMYPRAFAVAGAFAAVAGVWFWRSYISKGYGSETRATDLISTSLGKEQVAGEWNSYDTYFTQRGDGEGVASGDKNKAPSLVNTFYNLVTDIYEWGWGQSFHFSPAVEGLSDKQAERLHEKKIADKVGLAPGVRCLDAGCGVGGPMRAIAEQTGGTVVGITINDYQVARCEAHNAKAGLSGLCSVTQGNFLSMPFEDGEFDAAYSIEATCHAPNLESVYREIYRVMKPGALYATYEWLKTPRYDASNAEHVKIIDDICHGNALPDLRTAADARAAAKAAGFELVEDADYALPPAGPWWRRLKISSWEYKLNHVVVSALCAVGVAPKGTQEVHRMLVDVAGSLAQAGELGIFTPMHLMVFKKPGSA